MATARDTYKGSNEYSDVKCSVCAKKKKEQTADYYCYDCRKHLCTSCLGTHDEFNENHNVVQGLGDDKDVITERCGKHADELITLYCRQHNRLLCRKCHFLDHRNCQDLKNIRESADELNADPDLQAVPAQLKSAFDNIDKAIKVLDNHVACIQKNGDGFLKDLEEYAKKLLSRIEKLRVKSKTDIKSKQKELLSVAKQHRQACVLTKDELNQCLDKITKSNEWKANIFVLKKKGQAITQKVDRLYNDLDSLIKGRHFYFITDRKIFDSLKCFSSLVNEVYTNVQDISSLGFVGGVVQATVGRPGDSEVEKLEERPFERPGEKPLGEKSYTRSQHVRTIKAHIAEDEETCNIFGCCTLSDGSLMIADYSNSKLKRVDPSSRKVTQYCDINKGSWNACCIGSQEIAVAFPSSTQVHVYNTDSLAWSRAVELGHKTAIITSHGGLLYCAELDGNTLYVHDVSSGRKLRKISMETVCRINGIAVNSSGNRVYVTGGGLVCFSAHGRLIFNLSQIDLGLSKATGVTTDNHGHVFVCGYESYNVVKVTEDGHVVGRILSEFDGIAWSPLSISYDVSRNYLYVGGENSD